MIAHGRKQISELVYARKASEGGGAVRLTNMIRGGAVVFGGLYPKVSWLYPPTRAAILGAFGVSDGKAVIKATNAYLNGIAATDPTKAQQIADWLNTYAVEDAKIVYSLVEGIGTRWLCGNKSAYINTGYTYSAASTRNFKFIKPTNNSQYDFWHGANSSSNEVLFGSPNYLGGGRFSYSWQNNTIYEVELSTITGNCYLYVNGTKVRQTTGKGNNGSEWLFKMNGGSGTDMKISYYDRYDNGIQDLKLVPFIHKDNGVEYYGMIDLLTGTFYGDATGNNGFTISESQTP